MKTLERLNFKKVSITAAIKFAAVGDKIKIHEKKGFYQPFEELNQCDSVSTVFKRTKKLANLFVEFQLGCLGLAITETASGTASGDVCNFSSSPKSENACLLSFREENIFHLFVIDGFYAHSKQLLKAFRSGKLNKQIAEILGKEDCQTNAKTSLSQIINGNPNSERDAA